MIISKTAAVASSSPRLSAAPLHLRMALAVVLASALAATGCGDGSKAPTSTVGNAGLELQVAPLNLQQIGYACYDITVYAITDPITFAPMTVWSRGDYWTPHRSAGAPAPVLDTDTLCSNLFGNGPQGDILYIGTCDATYPTHVVELVIDGLYKPLGEPIPEGSDWSNPCPASNPCQFYAECRENADTPVVINLTILRSANQGFFDIAVRFDDIFCSAKVDCDYRVGDANGDGGGRRSAATSWTPIELVHNGDGEPGPTAVIGFACTTGPGEKDETELYLNAPRIECGFGDVRAATQNGTICHDGGERQEFLSFNWFIAQSAPPGGWDGDWLDDGVTVAQAIETNHFTGGVGALALESPLPLVDSNHPGNDPYDAVVPFLSLGEDQLLAYAIRFGSSPLGGGDGPDFSALHLAVVSRVPNAPTANWTRLDVFATLPNYVMTANYLRDPSSGAVVVKAYGLTPGGNAYADLLVFNPMPTAPWYNLSVSAPVPSGIDINPRMLVDDVLLANFDGPGGYSLAVNKLSWGTDGGTLLNMSNIFGTIPTFTESNGVTWTLTEIRNDNAYIVSSDFVLATGEWSSTSGTINFPVLLKLATQTDPFGNTDYGFFASPADIAPDFDDLSSDNLNTWFDWRHGRGFSWRARGPGEPWHTYVTHFPNGTPPYNDLAQTWRVPVWNDFVPDVEQLIEQNQGPTNSYPTLIVGRESSDVWTTDACTSNASCSAPPSGDYSATCQSVPDVLPLTPGSGFCRYQHNGGFDIYRYVLGYLPPGDSDVVWIGEIPKPADAGRLDFRSTRIITGGSSILIRYEVNDFTDGYMTLRVLHAPATPDVPTIGSINLLQSEPTFVVSQVRSFTEDIGDSIGHDARFYAPLGTCSDIEVGFGVVEFPDDSDPVPHFQMFGALWDLNGSAVVGTDPNPSLLFSPQPLSPTPAFQSYVNDTLTMIANSDNAYVVLDLDHPEGYVWDEASSEGPVYQYGLYYGSEELMCNGMSSGSKDVEKKEAEPKPAEPVGETVSCNKKYFNVAIGLNPGWENCMLAFEGTTAKPGVITEESGLETPTNAVYPILAARIPLWPNYGDGHSSFNNLTCGQHPINGKGSGFQTLYTMGTDKGGFPFCYRLGLDGRTIFSVCKADHDYRPIDREPIFSRSRQIRVDRIKEAEVAKAEAALSVRTAALSQRARGPQIVQFDSTWPECAEGFEYRPEFFACLGLCGDGEKTDDEGCDDGNLDNGDGCNSDCRVEVRCGDDNTLITEDQLCDGVQHCPRTPGSNQPAWDEAPGLCFWCGDGVAFVRSDRVCDGTAQCSNGRDEVGCAPATP